MSSPLVSIILPIYNSDKYLSKSIESVLRQNYAHWELMVVDDCSTDGSATLVKKYTDRDTRVKYLRLERNSGCYVARNVGITYATGDYLAFIDADDEYEENYLTLMVEAAERYNADMVWCNYTEHLYGENGELQEAIIRNHNLDCSCTLDCRELLRKFFQITWGTGSLWNKLFRRSFLDGHNIKFDEKRRRSGDWVYIIEMLRQFPQVVAIADSLYRYNRINTNSVVASFHQEDYLNFVKSLHLLDEANEELSLKIPKEGYYTDFLYNTISHIYRLYQSSYPGKKKELTTILRDETFLNILNKKEYQAGMLPIRFRIYLYVIIIKASWMLPLLMKI